MDIPERITWEQVIRIFKGFTVWAGNPELGWFHRAWEGVEKAGLSVYKDEIERQLVLIRAVTIGVIYNEFCQLAWDDYFDFDSTIKEVLFENHVEMGFHLLLLGQMASYDIVSEEQNEAILFSESLFVLVNDSRMQIYRCLSHHFGGDENLFLNLWISNISGNETIFIKDLPEEFVDYSVNNGRAYEYILMGMRGMDA